jgi:hypothetical protein
VSREPVASKGPLWLWLSFWVASSHDILGPSFWEHPVAVATRVSPCLQLHRKGRAQFTDEETKAGNVD